MSILQVNHKRFSDSRMFICVTGNQIHYHSGITRPSRTWRSWIVYTLYECGSAERDLPQRTWHIFISTHGRFIQNKLQMNVQKYYILIHGIIHMYKIDKSHIWSLKSQLFKIDNQNHFMRKFDLESTLTKALKQRGSLLHDGYELGMQEHLSYSKTLYSKWTFPEYHG